MNISVALATYNGAPYLNALLTSLINQQLLPIELVIVDDCSVDETLQIVENFKSKCDKFPVKIYTNEFNMGPSITFRKLLTLCNGDYIAFCDQDDIWFPNKIEVTAKRMQLIEQQKNASSPIVIFTDLEMMDNQERYVASSFFQMHQIEPSKWNFKKILEKNIITGCTTLINKTMINLMVDMPNNVLMYDYWMALIGFSFGTCDCCFEKTVRYRMHSNSVTQKQRMSIYQLLLVTLKKRSVYLEDNIEQAAIFNQYYGYKLDVINREIILNFINLSRKSFIAKRWFLYKYN